MSRATKTIKKNFLKRRTKKIRRNLPKMSRELSLLTTTFPKCRANLAFLQQLPKMSRAKNAIFKNQQNKRKSKRK